MIPDSGRIKRIVGENPGIERRKIENEFENGSAIIDLMIEKGILVKEEGGLKVGTRIKKS